jgi:hypothetical protein
MALTVQKRVLANLGAPPFTWTINAETGHVENSSTSNTG